jgi:pimeloyl-ACP methyl ester carboxylesterase
MKNKLPAFSLVALLLAIVIAGLWVPVYRQTHRRFTYVIVHGAFGGGWGFHELDDLMTADGQKVYRPTLSGQGDRYHLDNPSITLNTHIQDIVNTIIFEDLHDIVLVGHSYGGMVITGVVDRIPERIKCVIYLDAVVPENGETEYTVANNALKHTGKVKINAQGGIDSGWEKSKKPLPHDEPEPGGAFSTPISLKNQTIARAIPTTFILYVPPGKQITAAKFYAFYQRAIARGWKTGTFISDHNAQWSHPRELANLLESIP